MEPLCLKHYNLIVFGYIRILTRKHIHCHIPNTLQSICYEYYAGNVESISIDWSFGVIGRFRQASSYELKEQKMMNIKNDDINIIDNKKVNINKLFTNDSTRERNKTFTCTLDHIFSENTSQSEFYLCVGERMVKECLKGYNTSILIYGQTGSGQQRTLFGSDNEFGLLQRCTAYLLYELKHSSNFFKKCKLSIVAIYKGITTDMLDESNEIKPELNIDLDCENNRIYIDNLKYVPLKDIDDLLHNLKRMRLNVYNSFRTSCRFHLVVTLDVEQRDTDAPFHCIKHSKLQFVKFSGSEDIRKALGNNPDPERMREAIALNSDLSAFCMAIQHVSRGIIASFQRSPLTKILKDSIGGNSKTLLIVTASPHICNRNETLRTLRFALIARMVRNHPKINFRNKNELPYFVKINKQRICKPNILTVTGYIRSIFIASIPEEIMNIILFFYCKPMVMNVMYKKWDGNMYKKSIKYILYCPVSDNWDSVMTKLCNIFQSQMIQNINSLSYKWNFATDFRNMINPVANRNNFDSFEWNEKGLFIAEEHIYSSSDDEVDLWRQNLKPGDLLDCKGKSGLWWTATVIGYKGNSDRLLIRYDGWGDQYDEVIDRTSDRLGVWMVHSKGKSEKEIIKEGFMSKEGKIFKTWKRRYFILDDKGKLNYYRNKDDDHPIGFVNIKLMKKTERISFGRNRSFGIKIHTETRVWKLLCENENDLAEWIYAFNFKISRI